MQRVLVSACLLGQPVRYDGGTVVTEGGILARWQMEGRVIPVCPEMAGGLPVPRPPAEIHGEGGGAAVLRGAAACSSTTVAMSPAHLFGARNAPWLQRRRPARRWPCSPSAAPPVVRRFFTTEHSPVSCSRARA